MRLDKLGPNKRRYDSLAILIQGDDVCGASCFNGTRVLLATNKNKKSELVNKVQKYLKYVAQKSSERLNSEALSKLIIPLKQELLTYVSANIRLFQNSKTYAKRFKTALNKITHSLRDAYNNPRHPAALPFKMAEVMRKGAFVFIEKDDLGLHGKRPLHAEMQILDHLYLHTRELFDSNNFYIGVSKKCCANCMTAIESINVARTGHAIEVRGEGHGFRFASSIPAFLKCEEVIRQAFLKISGIDSIEKVFSSNDEGKMLGEDQLLTPSSSVYETTSSHDSQETDLSISHEEAELSGLRRPSQKKPHSTKQKNLAPVPLKTMPVKKNPSPPPQKIKASTAGSPKKPMAATTSPALFSKKPRNPKKTALKKTQSSMSIKK